MVCGLVPTAKLVALVLFLSSFLSLFFLFHSCTTPPPQDSLTLSGDNRDSCILLKGVFSYNDGKSDLLDGLKITLRRGSAIFYRRDFKDSISTEMTSKIAPHFSRPTSPFFIRAPPDTKPAEHAPPGQNKPLKDKADNANAAKPNNKDGPPEKKGGPPPPPPPPAETQNTATGGTTTPPPPANTIPPKATQTTPPSNPPATSSPAAPIVANTNTHPDGASPNTVTTSPPPSQTVQTGSGPASSISNPAAILTSPSSANPLSTPTLSISAMPDYTTSLSPNFYPSLSAQPSSGLTAFPTVISSENLSRNVHHSKLAIILGVLIPLLALAAVILAFILIRRRILRTRRERDVEDNDTDYFLRGLRDPFGIPVPTTEQQLAVGRSDMLNMFRVSGRTPEPSILSSPWSGENVEGRGGPENSEKQNPDRNSDASFSDAEKPNFRDSRYSDSDTSWIWYRPPMAI